MGPIGARELIILLVVAMILFGSKRLPQAARSLGQSMRILKAETKGLRDDDKVDHEVPPPVIPPAQQAYQAPAQAPEAAPQTHGSTSTSAAPPYAGPPVDQPGTAGDGPR